MASINGELLLLTSTGDLLFRRDFDERPFTKIDSNVRAFTSDGFNTYSVRTDGSVWIFDAFDRLIPQQEVGFTPAPVSGLPLNVKQLSTGTGVIFAATDTGELYVFPTPTYLSGNQTTAVKVNTPKPILQIGTMSVGQDTRESDSLGSDKFGATQLVVLNSDRKVQTATVNGVESFINYISLPGGGFEPIQGRTDHQARLLFSPTSLAYSTLVGVWDGFGLSSTRSTISLFATDGVAPPVDDWEASVPCPKQKLGGAPVPLVCGKQTYADGTIVWNNDLTIYEEAGRYEIYWTSAIRQYKKNVGKVPYSKGGKLALQVLESTFPLPVFNCYACDLGYGTEQAVIKAVDLKQGLRIKVRAFLDRNGNGTWDQASEESETFVNVFRRPVALGDSYSSGEGTGDWDAGTDTVANNCHRGAKAYARRLNIAAEPGAELNGSDVRLYSCSGGQTYTLLKDLRSSTDQYDNQERDFIQKLNPGMQGFPQVIDASFPGGPNNDVIGSVEKRQLLTAEGEALKPDYVTVGVGGNDMRFAALLTDLCLTGASGPCQQGAVVDLSAEDQILYGPLIAATGKSLSRTLCEIVCLG